MCPLFVRLNFGQKCKAIALLFGLKLTIFITDFFDQKCVRFLSGSIFGKNDFFKAMALLFSRKLSKFNTDIFGQKCVRFLSGSILGKNIRL